MENSMNYDLEKSFEVLLHYLEKIVVVDKDKMENRIRISDDSDCKTELESALAVILEKIRS